MSKLKKLIEKPEVFQSFLEKLPETDRAFVEKYVLDLQSHLELDPLKKFKHNNAKQLEFLKFTKPFQYFIGGNKGGKTATITYKGVLIALGLLPEFSRKPQEGKPLINWLCGEDRNVLEQTPLEEITKWLRPDQYKIIKKGTVVDRIRIFVDHTQKVYSDFIFKPYSSGVDIFESANVSGCILCDEEIPEDIFRALIPRMVAHGAWLMNALTPTHGLTYTRDVIEGSGNYSGLKGENLVQTVEVATFENLANIDPAMFRAMIAAYSVYDENGKQVFNFDGSPKLNAEGEIRLMGRFASVTGKVYPNFRRELYGKNWHTFDLHELPDLTRCKFFGLSDYGRRDCFTFALVAVDDTDTHWFLEEIYESYLETTDQARKIREVCDNWEVKPIMIVADCQIKNKKALGSTILNDYLTARDPEGKLYLGENFTSWRAKYEDKMAPETARAEIGKMLNVNPKTGKPSYRFNKVMCSRHVKCLESLEWKKAGASEGTAGSDDHGEAGLRYYTRAHISFNEWKTEEEMAQEAQVQVRYSMGGNYRPLLSRNAW